jgi:methylenetetrahydrofolate dehydrogenase (NADP+) / methenyltetrahydrofolate cyclohydrolase
MPDINRENRNKIFEIRTMIERYDLPVFHRHRDVYARHGIRPQLVTVLAGDDPGSVSYVKGIQRFAAGHGIRHRNLTASTRSELESLLPLLNQDGDVDGIMVLYPSGFDVRDTVFMNLLCPEKDVEGLHAKHLGRLVQFEKFKDPQRLRKWIIPPTPKGIMYLLKRCSRDYEEIRDRTGRYPGGRDDNPFLIEGRRFLVINDSLAVGRSLALMLLNENGSVQVCHEYTAFQDILAFARTADVIVSAVPSGDFRIPTASLRKGAIAIDVSFEGNFEYPGVFERVFRIAPRWNLVKKGNRINDLTLWRLVSNLYYLVNAGLPDAVLRELEPSANNGTD